MATVTFSAADDVLYAYLAGEIDHDAAQNLRIQLDDALLNRTPRTLVLDFGGVGFMDSSGIGLILGRQRCARTLGGSLRIDAAFRPHRKRQHRFGAQLARMNHGNIQIFDIPYDLRIVALRKLRHIDRFLKWDLPAHRLQPARLPAIQHPEHKLSPDQHLFPLNP